MSFATLILNADAAPISLLPLSTISWEESIRYLVSEKATPLEWYDDWIVRSEHWSTKVPSVMMLNEYQKKKTVVRFSKQNVFLRDKFICQYCNVTVTKKTATLDHILPQSYGGISEWANCCTACGTCNSNKGNNRSIVPKIKPRKPDYWELVNIRRHLGWEFPHPSWEMYIGKKGS